MADWHSNSMILNTRKSMKDFEDFEEEDIWSVVHDTRDVESPPNNFRKSKASSAATSDGGSHGGGGSGGSSVWRTYTSPRKIPKSIAINPTTILARTEATATTNEVVQQSSSAPVNIPDWSKIYGQNNALTNHNYGFYDCNKINEDDEEEKMVPPHEWLAKKLARSKISSFSVCEGIGRTLKGRDLSKMRNAILTKTGFLE